uniref:protein TOC75-3, chloroplastic-like n=1 Tax=Erigeron canadensis TaxID=72917 RepID=UPI001CB959A6|nr:protein TOC75-3, chloroplastic-like [Erigeron canadensis]
MASMAMATLSGQSMITLHQTQTQTRIRTRSSFSTTSPSSVIIRSNHSTIKCTKLSSHNDPKHRTKTRPILKPLLTVAVSAAAGIALHAAYNTFGNGGSSGGGGGGGNGGGGGGGFWSFWKRLFTRVFKAEENDQSLDLNKLNDFKKYKLSEIMFFDISKQDFVNGLDDWLYDIVWIRSGNLYTKAQLKNELQNLVSSGFFEKVNFELKPKADGTIGVIVSFLESTWEKAENFRCYDVGLLPFGKQNSEMMRMERVRPCILSEKVHNEIMQMVNKDEGDKVSFRVMMERVRDRLEKWYRDEGYVLANVVNVFKLKDRKEVVCEMVEGDINQVETRFQDEFGNVCKGNTRIELVNRQLPKQLQEGNVFNIEAWNQGLNNLISLSLFSNVEVYPRPAREGGFVLEIKLQEKGLYDANVNPCNWRIEPRFGGLPTLAEVQPGGTATFKRRNINGLNRSIYGSVTTSNFLKPQDDLEFELQYLHPYLDGVSNPRNRTLQMSCSKTRKHSPDFTGGPEVPEVPNIWVNSSGIKANISEDIADDSKLTYGIAMEKRMTRDGSNHITSNGKRFTPNGDIRTDGLPTTSSGTHIDQSAFAQASIVKDNTKFVNGAIVGTRNVFQVDQGLGIGSKFPLFNRHQLTMTKFIPLKKVEEGAGKSPPPVLVLHGNYGRYMGDLPSYDAFILGGPYSVRGYNPGEIGTSKKMLELAAEVRVPVKKAHVFAFAEHRNDLGSSKDVNGNATEVDARKGHGSSFGARVMIGPVRAEYAVNLNSEGGGLSFSFGDRF